MARRIWSAKRAGGLAAITLVAAFALTALSAPRGHAAFPGANGRIVFASNRAALDGSTDFEIYSMLPDGTDVRQLTDNTTLPPSTEEGSGGSGHGGGSGGSTTTTTASTTVTSSATTTTSSAVVPTPIDDTQPAVSPDGRRIAFVSNRPTADGSTDTEIYVMNADGSDVRQVTNDRPGSGSGNDYEPAWSPDGRQIVYRHGDGRLADLYIVDVATGQETRLVTLYDKGPAAYDGQPSWSPDGTKIAFRKGMGTSAGIWIYDLLSGRSYPLIDSPSVPESSPSWSPNGREIAFVRGDEGRGGGIWIASADGSGERPVDQPVADANGLIASDQNPRWSPDGTKIVFQSTRNGILRPAVEEGTTGATGDEGGSGGHGTGGEEEDTFDAGNIDLYVVNVDGTGLTQLTTDTAKDQNPDWQTIPLPAEEAVPLTPTPAQLAPPVVEVPVAAPEQVSAPARGGVKAAVCVSRRVERIHVWLTARDRRHLKSSTVTVNGRRVKVHWAGRQMWATIDMRGVRRTTVTVAISIWLRNQIHLQGTRRYRTCVGPSRAGVNTFRLSRHRHSKAYARSHGG